MDNDKQTESEQPLDDTQRIEQLESAHKLDRMLLIALGGVLMVIFASWITYAVVALSGEDDDAVSTQAVNQLQQQVTGLEQQITALKQQLATQQASAPPREAPTPASTDDPAVTRQVAKTLIGQERNFQQSLTALKQGMRDLAAMIPGSRSWLTSYHETLDVPLGESRARAKELESWVEHLPTQRPLAEAPIVSAPAAAPASAP